MLRRSAGFPVWLTDDHSHLSPGRRGSSSPTTERWKPRLRRWTYEVLYCRAEASGALIAIKSPRIESDWTDDDVPSYDAVLDGFLVFDAGGWRVPSEEERGGYTDDIRGAVR
jgi:hypothetical protein